MELNSLLELTVLILIIIEIYSLIRHSKLEHSVEEHMELLDEHIRQLNEHPLWLDEHLNIHNMGLEDKDQET